jgi:hypothetical protein
VKLENPGIFANAILIPIMPAFYHCSSICFVCHAHQRLLGVYSVIEDCSSDHTELESLCDLIMSKCN